MARAVALAHITPSGDGLRVVLKRAKGKTIEQAQHEWCELMCLDAKPDAACKDISRLSFAPMHKEVLYYNPSLLFAEMPEASDYPDGTIFSGVSSRDGVIPSEERDLAKSPGEKGLLGETKVSFVATDAHSASAQREILRVAQNDIQDGASYGTRGAEQYPTDYNGLDYSSIVSRLEEQLGGRPEHGARNSFVFTMACNLRYVCNDDAQWIASILPTYGEDPQKHRMTIQSAVNRPMSRTMPETLKRALGVAKMCSEGGKSEIINHKSELPPAMPKALPALMELLTSRAPERMKAAVAMSVFPPLGAHLHEVKVVYADGREYEPTFMNVLVGELSSGKSAVNAPIEYIIADIEARDEVALEKEAAWKERCATLKTTEDKPTRPKGLAVQIMPADMTNAAFVQKLVDAEGKFLYTQMDEIELLNALKTGGNASMMSAVLRLAFDCGKYGQSRVAANAVSARVRVRWNWNASSTVQRVRKYFAKNIADGTLSRLSFATILKDEDDWGHKMPKFAVYGQPFADALAPYIDRLTTCKGTLHCPEAAAWAEALCQDLVTEAEKMDDRPYAQFAFRAVLMGFFRAMVLYIMEGMQWTQAIADFAAWSVRYDMWCKMRFFADMLRSDLEGEQTAIQRGRANLLTLLPDEFTREQVRDVRVAQGMKPNPKNMLAQWVSRGYIKLEATRGVYVKC
jgi:hypothetical protein